jgi:hypothetical protein
MSSVDVLRHIVKEEEKTLNTIFGVNVQTEVVELFGKKLEVKKAALQSRYTVAWVLNDQSCGCMRCDNNFGLLRWKHHCRQCGYLVCHGCSPSLVVIPEINEGKLGSRACKTCTSPRTGSFDQMTKTRYASSPGLESVATDSESLESFEPISA